MMEANASNTMPTDTSAGSDLNEEEKSSDRMDDSRKEVEEQELVAFRDESTDCAICLCPLVDDDDDDNERKNPVITLPTCGHKWHLHCLEQQMEQARPNPAYRLVLTGCRCAKFAKLKNSMCIRAA